MFSRFGLCVIVSAVLVCSGWSASTSRGAVTDPWVTTDRTVDCSSYDTILKGVLKDGMTDEQKCIALYSFYRQRVYHYINMPEGRDPFICINVLGNTLCGSQATCMNGLLNAAGIKARIANFPGHTFYEAFYGGAWHGYDTFTNFYIYTRGDNRHVASFKELVADPTLISDAVKEGRACPYMCPCGDDPMSFAKTNSYNEASVLKLDWSVKNNSLRKGEEMIRSWWPGGKPLAGTFNKKLGPGPLHTCGTHDRHAEPELFKFWEPYGIARMGPSTSVSYRHYTNGLINYSPDLKTDDYKDQLTSETGIKSSPDGLKGPGELVIPVTCSYYISAGQCLVQATCAGADDSVTLSVSRDGKQWNEVLVAKDAGNKQYAADLDKTVVKPEAGLHAYSIKFVLKGNAVLNHFLLQTYFTHNAMAAPHLMPGKNEVTVTCGNGDAMSKSALAIIYRYKDAPDWKGELKTIEKPVTSSPFTFEAVLPDTPKLPQMLDLTLRNGTLAWMPPDAWAAPTPPGQAAAPSAK